MARATRSTTAADLKRKRSVDGLDVDNAPNKHPRTDVPIDGQPILDILEAEDHQGLLDRVFPPDVCVSLRTLLTARSTVPALKAAIAQLQPISSVPRATLSPTARQQQRFCDLALSLIDQAYAPSSHVSSSSIISSPKQRAHRPQPSYALVQHLPGGDYWSSLASISNPSDIQTGNAELVAIFPTPSTDKQSLTLAAYSRPLPPKKPPLSHRRVTTGTFLDYGLFSSFAPSFDQDGELVGRRELGEVMLYQHDKLRSRQALELQRCQATAQIVEITQEDEEPVIQQIDPSLDLQLESLLSPDDVDAIKATLSTLEFETSVQKLLEQNERALVRLEGLQMQRLTSHPTSPVEEGSEEWDTAQAILDSLTLLASLRPRSSSEEGPAIIPPPSVLHKLHRTLALDPSPGWYGTLPATRTIALRDDSTLKVRPGAAATPAVSQPSAAAAAAATATPVAAANHFAYAYTPGQQQVYRPPAASYAAYKPGQTPSYYQTYVTQPVQQQQGYYSQAAYGTANQQPYGAAMTGQQAYANYSAWYSQYSAAQTGTASGRGTPQPVVATPATMATTYGSFFNSAAASTPTAAANSARTPAVANTVVSNTTTSTAPVGAVPTLPIHLRGNQNVTANGSTAQQSYFSTYQVQQTQPAR